MKELICIYDSKLADKGTHSFMKAIQNSIKGVEFLDVHNPNVDWNRYTVSFCANAIGILALKPIEGTYNNELLDSLIKHSLDKVDSPLVVEAILRVLGDVAGKDIVVINQSENLGIPLVVELMKRKAVITNLPRHKGIFHMLNILESCEILITATGDNEFKISTKKTDFAMDIAIDLSDDIEDGYPHIYEKHIKKVPIIEILKERLGE